jgi:hypothetical protein
MPGPMDLLGGGGGGMGWQQGLLMGLGQMGQNMASGKQAGGVSGGISRAMQQMAPMMQAKREQEMWEALQKRIAQQQMMAGDMGRMASPGVQAGGAGPPMGAVY